MALPKHLASVTRPKDQDKLGTCSPSAKTTSQTDPRCRLNARGGLAFDRGNRSPPSACRHRIKNVLSRRHATEESREALRFCDGAALSVAFFAGYTGGE